MPKIARRSIIKQENKPFGKPNHGTLHSFSFRPTKTGVFKVTEKKQPAIIADANPECVVVAVNKFEQQPPCGLRSQIDKLIVLFEHADKLLWLYYGSDRSGASFSFSKLRPQVEGLSGRNFSLINLRQIMHILPNAYILLRIGKTSEFVVEFASQTQELQPRYSDPQFLAIRRHAFEAKCESYVRQHPNALSIPLHDLPESRSRQNLAVTQTRSEIIMSLQKNAHEVLMLARKETKIIQDAPRSNESVAKRQSSLLERIKLKQATKALQVANSPDPQVINQITLLCRAKLIIDILIHLQIGAGPLGIAITSIRKVIEAVRDSLRNQVFTENEIRQTIELLATVIPNWCTVSLARDLASVKLVGLAMCGLSRVKIIAIIDNEIARLQTSSA
ncbi:hypothetical protein V1514DRAFT_367373 [Lipomyces japonicus]|uniref:uncharacterized protein n=1 Tax=Lipomyces japonicus TaxID=56871 RepID=UPI0034CD497D